MKLILVSDLHLVHKNPQARTDDLVETQFKKFEFILKFARRNKAALLVAGDFFNIPRSWMLLPRVIGVLKYYDVPVYAVYGQHDTYLYSEETRERTNLGVLAKARLVKVLDDVPVGEDDALLYGCSFGSEIPAAEVRKDLCRVLVIHAPISNRAVYPGQKFTMGDKFLKDHPEFDLVICGDIHIQFEERFKGRFIFNTGPVVRKEATEYNFMHKPSLVLFDTETREYEWVEIPHAVAESVLDRSHIDRAEEISSILDGFVKALPGESEVQEVGFNENLLAFIRANKIERPVVDLISEIMEERNDK